MEKPKKEYMSTTVSLSKENDDWIRQQLRRKGDYGRILNECIDKVRALEKMATVEVQQNETP